ncbi:glycosyltransferase [Candidatus Saccharibacteria bacterium]|nr:glycosyltransferase [Candidatus Saccharibacteria bacterium]
MNMRDVKVSIVVPMYNSSEYLRECLDSLAGQSLKEVEFVLVNDGSTDSTLEIANEYRRNDKRFRIIDKENTGYGDSVNKGIDLAKGEYVGIVEPDDYCDKEMFGILYDIARINKVDVAKTGYYLYSKGETKVQAPLFKNESEITIEPIKKYVVFFEPPAIWSGIYRREFLKKNRITLLRTPGASYQDAGFNFKVLACAEKVSYVSKPLYYYRTDNPGSSVKDLKKTMAVVNEYESVEEFVGRLKNKELLLKYCQVAKFGAYHWNLLRLKRQDARRFMKTMKKEFRIKKGEGLLDRRYFPKKYWISLEALLILPISLYLVLFELRKCIKKSKMI